MPKNRGPDVLRRKQRERKEKEQNAEKQKRHRATARLARGLRTIKSGEEKFWFSPATGTGVAIVSLLDSIPHLRKFLDQPPMDFEHSMRQAGLFGVTAFVGTALVGGAQRTYGRIVAGKNLKKLKPLIWGKRSLAKEVIEKLEVVGTIDPTLKGTIECWGQGLEAGEKPKFRTRKPRTPKETQVPYSEKDADVT